MLCCCASLCCVTALRFCSASCPCSLWFPGLRARALCRAGALRAFWQQLAQECLSVSPEVATTQLAQPRRQSSFQCNLSGFGFPSVVICFCVLTALRCCSVFSCPSCSDLLCCATAHAVRLLGSLWSGCVVSLRGSKCQSQCSCTEDQRCALHHCVLCCSC